VTPYRRYALLPGKLKDNMNPFDGIEKKIESAVDAAEARLFTSIQLEIASKAVQAGLRDLIALDPDPKGKAKWQAALSGLE
jgi:hypothetical protein